MADNPVFEFPDEVEEKSSRLGSKVVAPEPEAKVEAEAPEIEIVDDTPEEDRGREPMKTPPQEPTDDELVNYTRDERAAKIREFTKGYHEERRQKEAALREREQAIAIAKAVMEENERLKGTVDQSQTALIEQAKRVVAQEIEEAKRKYKTAYESGDADAVTEAVEALTVAKMKADRISHWKPRPALQPQENAVQPAPSAPAFKPDPKAEDWQRANSWFGQDKEMTAFALAVHDRLVNEDQIDPNSDEYYRRLDGRLRQVFADKFESAEPAETKQRPKSNVVASATRSTAPKKITLSSSEVAIAKRLGIPLERYAREVAVLRRNANG